MNKFLWALRYLIYIPFMHKSKFPGYIGKPCIFVGKKNVTFEKKVRIYPGARIEMVKDGKLIIGSNVSIAQNFHCTSGGVLRIGDNTTILGNVFITNIDHDYKEIGKHILEQKQIIRETIIGENCFIGYGASIQAGTILGKQCIVGTNAVVRGVFPDYCVIVGVPARIIKIYDSEKKEWVRYDK